MAAMVAERLVMILLRMFEMNYLEVPIAAIATYLIILRLTILVAWRRRVSGTNSDNSRR